CINREDLHRKARKVPAQASEVAGDSSSPLDVDSDPDIHDKLDPSTELKDATDCHWVIAHVTPPSWKQYLREISIEQLCDIHDKAYIRQAVLGNVLNGRIQELIFVLHKARVSCDTIREREIKKDKAYAELEKKCNEPLQDLYKNPLVYDMRSEIDTLQSQDRANVVSRVILDATMKLIHSDERDVLIAKLIKASIIYGRCTAFEEEEYDRAGNDLADASYPFLAELAADPHAFVDLLLLNKPRMIPEPGDPNREVPVNETFHVQTDDELTEKELKQIEADDQAIHTILLGLPKDIYAAVDSCETA
nr:ribonuclease H-like domain-containing protein [Tanacetum cinerariifolium]